MPVFQWRGRTNEGAEMSGTLDANSREAVMEGLRRNGITVSTIDEVEKPPARLKSFIFALVLLAAAALLTTISKGARIRCTRAGDAYDCTIETLMGGYRTLYAENVRGVHSATDEHRAGSGGRRGGSAASSRVVIAGATRTISTEWLQSALPTSTQTMNALNRQFGQNASSAAAWQIEAAPMGVALLFGIAGLLMLFRAMHADDD